MDLPHTFPFRWVEREEADVALVELTTNSFWLRDGGRLPLPFCAEILAQAAARLLAGRDPERGRERWLAGIEDLTLERPLLAGDRFEVRVTLRARLGGLLKVDGELRDASGQVARGSLILA